MVYDKNLSKYGIIILALCFIFGALNLIAQGPVLGDLTATRLIQAIFGSQPLWAELLTKSATEPFCWSLATATALLAWKVAGWRLGWTPLLTLALVLHADKLLRAFLYSPRPLASLVLVAKPSASSGLPSTFGLVYGATVGLLLMLSWRKPDLFSRAAAGIALATLFLGMVARMTMGGHWASQIIASYGFAMALGYGVAWLVRR